MMYYCITWRSDHLFHQANPWAVKLIWLIKLRGIWQKVRQPKIYNELKIQQSALGWLNTKLQASMSSGYDFRLTDAVLTAYMFSSARLYPAEIQHLLVTSSHLHRTAGSNQWLSHMPSLQMCFVTDRYTEKTEWIVTNQNSPSCSNTIPSCRLTLASMLIHSVDLTQDSHCK